MRPRFLSWSLPVLVAASAVSCGPGGGERAAPARGAGAAASLGDEIMASVTLEGLRRSAGAIVQYPRPSGSPGENAAIDSVVAALREAGVPVEVHTFETYGSDPVGASLRVPAAGLTLPAITMAYSGPARGLRGRLVDVGSLSDLPGLEPGTGERLALEGDAGLAGGGRRGIPDLAGAIALVEGQPRNVPTAVLALLGAQGIVFTNPEDRVNDLIVTSTWGTPSLRSYQRLPRIPAVQVSRSHGDRLRALMAQGPVVAEVDAEVSTGRRPLRLAVARIEAPAPDAPYVLLGGHIDAWHHGATDEGASNAAMVELAKEFHARRDRLRRGIVVAWWPGHSNARYAGSTWFADHYFMELRDRAVAYLNVDGIGQVDAAEVSATATASMGALAHRVARDQAGLAQLPLAAPGRNSDQSFNGVGLPLLQFNHTRREEDGGYWWWHTPDDTYDKIDFEVLHADVALYAGALAHLAADPVLPVDMAAEVEALGREIEHRAEQSGGRLDLAGARALQTDLLQTVRALSPRLEAHEGPELDRAVLAILRPLYRVMYDPVDPYHPDPGFSQGLLPGLAPVTILVQEDPSSDRYLFAETTLVRERNRLVEALEIALYEAEALRRRVEG